MKVYSRQWRDEKLLWEFLNYINAQNDTVYTNGTLCLECFWPLFNSKNQIGKGMTHNQRKNVLYVFMTLKLELSCIKTEKGLGSIEYN